MKWNGIELKFDEPVDDRVKKLLKLRLNAAYAIYLKRAKRKLAGIYKAAKPR